MESVDNINFRKRKKKCLALVLIFILINLIFCLFKQSYFYYQLEYQWDCYLAQKERDKEWGHLEYDGDDILEKLKDEFVDEDYDVLSELELDYDEALALKSNVYSSVIGNGIFMNELGGTGDVSFLRVTVYAFENTSIGGVDVAMHVYDISKDVVEFAEYVMEVILPTGHQEIIDSLNDIDFRGGDFFVDNRKVSVEFGEEGITFLFYGKGEVKK